MTYEFAVEICDVEDKDALARYREKRTLWLDWLSSDEHHAIGSQISSMVWNDVTFRFLAHTASLDEQSALLNPLLGESLVNGHFAMQTLAIRRLADKAKDVVSLRRLVSEMQENRHLFTREIFVAHDGLPYEYALVEHRIMLSHLGKKGPFWGAKTGPDAHRPSENAHKIFDSLCGTDPLCRKRSDRIPGHLFETISKWFDESDVDDLVSWHRLAETFTFSNARAYVGTLFPISTSEVQEVMLRLIEKEFQKPLAGALWAAQRHVYRGTSRRPYIVTGVYTQWLRTTNRDVPRDIYRRLQEAHTEWVGFLSNIDPNDKMYRANKEIVDYHVRELQHFRSLLQME